ncbi:FMN-dependent dehydrogenase [Lipomyces oligophaga]|uniref:FMN-dependent dehydrogenase n=1 Tax=Lipomyces oligophaga TaxID=45792 RepID=UPI0034CD0C1E
MGELSELTRRPTNSWDKYQVDIYSALVPPKLPTDLLKLEEQARARLSSRQFNYIHGNAGQALTYQANRDAFKKYAFIPRVLRGVDQRNLSVELFGKKYKSPVLLGPVGVQKIAHPDGEYATARAAACIGIPFVLSTASSTNLEDVAEVHAEASLHQVNSSPNEADSTFETADRWYQLYWPRDDDQTESILHRAEEAGYSVLVVTLDTFSLGYRPADLDQSYLPFIWGEGCAIGFNDPVFIENYSKDLEKRPSMSLLTKVQLLVSRSQWSPRLLLSLLFRHKTIFKSLAWLAQAFPGKQRTWEDLRRLRQYWKGPIVLKGIQSVADARLASQFGMDGIIVSNHGGRQLDGAIASLDALAHISADLEVQKSGITILFDSGIRTGSDILKALALGAKAVLIGRPYIYGLALGGSAGIEHVVRCLLAEADISLANLGLQSISELNRDVFTVER